MESYKMKKYFIILLFILTSNFVPGLKADTQAAQTVQAEQTIQVEHVIQDKLSLQNFTYYFIFTILFIAFAVWISRKSKWPYFKYFIAYNCVVLLFSAVYHTATYGKNNYFKAAFDQEGFYFRPRGSHGIQCDFVERKSFQELLNLEWNNIKTYQYSNCHYYIFYRIIRDIIFPIKNFYAAFFFACLLNACFHLIGLFLFVEILMFLKCKHGYMLSICVLQHAPNFVVKNGLPLANSMSAFIMVLFLWLLIKRKNTILIFLCVYGFYFAQKIYYLLPFVLLSVFSLWHARKNKIALLGIALIGLLGSIFVFHSNKLSIAQSLQVNKGRINRSRGNSQILQTKYAVLKLCNSWFAPLVTNFTKFLVKPTKASKLGFLVAVFFNLVCIACLVLLIYHLVQGKWKFFPEEDKKVIFISLAIIAYLTVAFISVSNYLNLLRHKQCVMSVWYVLLGYFYRKTPQKSQKLESQNA